MSIVFTPGESAGIGPDLAVIYAQKSTRKNLLTFADPDLLLKRAKILNLDINIIESDKVKNKGDICIYPVKLKENSSPGILNTENSQYVLNCIELASDYCIENQNSSLVTGPIHKGVINKTGIEFTGHTEFLQSLCKVDKTVMMLATDGLRVALATTHVPLCEVSNNITADSLERVIRIIDSSLKSFGITNPNISVCGLNPHAGEDGYLGTEEIEIINPLIEKLNESGFNLHGSIPADTAFTPDALKNIDCVLSMYHDQGLPVLKTIGFKKAVNITLGLPFVRTSVDHGTALNLAGTGNISLGSLETAIYYADKYTN